MRGPPCRVGACVHKQRDSWQRFVSCKFMSEHHASPLPRSPVPTKHHGRQKGSKLRAGRAGGAPVSTQHAPADTHLMRCGTVWRPVLSLLGSLVPSSTVSEVLDRWGSRTSRCIVQRAATTAQTRAKCLFHPSFPYDIHKSGWCGHGRIMRASWPLGSDEGQNLGSDKAPATRQRYKTHAPAAPAAGSLPLHAMLHLRLLFHVLWMHLVGPPGLTTCGLPGPARP